MFSLELSQLLGWKHFGIPRRFEKISIDSRRVEGSELFVPLRGSRFDGHVFIGEALKRGAVGFLFERGKIPAGRLLKLTERAFALEVPNTLEALRKIAAYRRENFKGREIIAVTGTAGKTTVKELLAHLLSLVGKTYRSPKNLNSQIGFPLSLANAEDADFWVFELGASQRGDIKRNAFLLSPTLSVLTALGKAHLEGFKNFQNLAVAKGEIFLPKSVRTAVLPERFLNLYRHLLGKREVFTFGGESLRVQHFRFTAEGKTRLVLEGKTLEVNLLGLGIVRAVEAVAAALKALGLPHLELLLEGLPTFRGEWGRMEPLRGNGFLVINDAYNANPLSMRAALETLVRVEGFERRVALLGEMLELGEHSEEEHRKLGRLLNTLNVDEVYLFGKEMKAAYWEVKDKPCHLFFEMEDLLRFLKRREPRRGTVYLVKGSRGCRMEETLGVLLR